MKPQTASTTTTVRRRSPKQTASATTEEFVLNLKGSAWQASGARQRERIVDVCFAYWRARGFPFYRLSEREMLDEYNRLACAARERLLLGEEIQMSMTGMKLANFFHPQMWGVPVSRARSPLERFNDDEKLRKLIRRALAIWPDRYAVNDSNLRRMLKTFSNTAGVSNFRPTAAKAIYEQFSRDGDPVLDFSFGYGGRMLGCLPLDRHYIGIDPCAAQTRGVRRMLTTLTRLAKPPARVSIHRAPAEDFLPTLDARSVALVFSSPPYFNHERYSTERSQSWVRYPTYDEWLAAFLEKILAESRRVLEPGGYLVLNVADVNGFRIAEDARRLASKYFTLADTLRLRLGHKPYLRNRTGGVYKHEPVFIFRKSRRR